MVPQKVILKVYGYEVQFINRKTNGQITASFTHGDYKIGDKVQIYYDPDNPLNISVNKPNLTFLGPILPVLFIGILLLMMGIISVRTRWSNPY